MSWSCFVCAGFWDPVPGCRLCEYEEADDSGRKASVDVHCCLLVKGLWFDSFQEWLPVCLEVGVRPV